MVFAGLALVQTYLPLLRSPRQIEYPDVVSQMSDRKDHFPETADYTLTNMEYGGPTLMQALTAEPCSAC